MLLKSRSINTSCNFEESLNAIDRDNKTDAASTRVRTYDDVFETLDNCIDVSRFHQNVARDVRALNCDVCQTTFTHAANNVTFSNSRRAVNNAVAALAQQCNNSVVENGALATYKVASTKSRAQRKRNETVASHVYAQIRALLGTNQVYRSADFSAMIVGKYVFLMRGRRFYIISAYEVLEKHKRAAVKDLGFRQSTTSMIMYMDAENMDFNTVAQEVIRAFQVAVASQDSTTKQQRILANAYSAVA